MSGLVGAVVRVLHSVDARASRLVGALADARIPGRLRSPIYRTFARAVGADLSECLLPLEAHPSLGAFFVRRLATGARAIARDEDALVSPCDGRVQEVGRVERGSLLQAKGHSYSLAELTDGVVNAADWEGASVWTLYLSPKDYHRVHSPDAASLVAVRWIAGARHSVAPAVLARRMVFPRNERCVMQMQSARGPLLLVMVGARNVSRIRVVGVEPNESGALARPRAFARGEELARFELGSTVVLLAPPGKSRPTPTLVPGRAVRLGEVIGRWVGEPR
jgi:phosphatidylserine decarboxylase